MNMDFTVNSPINNYRGDSDSLDSYILNSAVNFKQNNRDWNWTDPLREGAAGIIQQFAPSDMETERLRSLVGLDDNQFIEAVRNGIVRREEWPLGRMPQQQRDDLLRGQIASRQNWKQNIDSAVNYVAPTPHAKPEGTLENIAYHGLGMIPGAIEGAAEFFALTPVGWFFKNLLTGNSASQEQVYRNLREQGLSPLEAREIALSPGGNLADLGIRGVANLATMHALGQSPMVAGTAYSPITQTLGNIGRASIYSGAGAAGEQALTNYRSGIDNEPQDLLKTGLIAGGTTAAMGLINMALNWRNLRELQREYNDYNRNKPINADFRDLGPDNPPALDFGDNPNPPDNNSPSGNGNALALPEHSEQTTAFKNEFRAKWNNAVTKRGFPAVTDDASHDASAQAVWNAIYSGKLSPEEGIALYTEAGMSPQAARSAVDAISRLNTRPVDTMERPNALNLEVTPDSNLPATVPPVNPTNTTPTATTPEITQIMPPVVNDNSKYSNTRTRTITIDTEHGKAHVTAIERQDGTVDFFEPNPYTGNKLILTYDNNSNEITAINPNADMSLVPPIQEAISSGSFSADAPVNSRDFFLVDANIPPFSDNSSSIPNGTILTFATPSRTSNRDIETTFTSHSTGDGNVIFSSRNPVNGQNEPRLAYNTITGELSAIDHSADEFLLPASRAILSINPKLPRPKIVQAQSNTPLNSPSLSQAANSNGDLSLGLRNLIAQSLIPDSNSLTQNIETAPFGNNLPDSSLGNLNSLSKFLNDSLLPQNNDYTPLKNSPTFFDDNPENSRLNDFDEDIYDFRNSDNNGNSQIIPNVSGNLTPFSSLDNSSTNQNNSGGVIQRRNNPSIEDAYYEQVRLGNISKDEADNLINEYREFEKFGDNVSQQYKQGRISRENALKMINDYFHHHMPVHSRIFGGRNSQRKGSNPAFQRGAKALPFRPENSNHESNYDSLLDNLVNLGLLSQSTAQNMRREYESFEYYHEKLIRKTKQHKLTQRKALSARIHYVDYKMPVHQNLFQYIHQAVSLNKENKNNLARLSQFVPLLEFARNHNFAPRKLDYDINFLRSLNPSNELPEVPDSLPRNDNLTPFSALEHPNLPAVPQAKKRVQEYQKPDSHSLSPNGGHVHVQHEDLNHTQKPETEAYSPNGGQVHTQHGGFNNTHKPDTHSTSFAKRKLGTQSYTPNIRKPGVQYLDVDNPRLRSPFADDDTSVDDDFETRRPDEYDDDIYDPILQPDSTPDEPENTSDNENSDVDALDDDGFIGQIQVEHFGTIYTLDVFADYAPEAGGTFVEVCDYQGYPVAYYIPSSDNFQIYDDYSSQGWTRNIEEVLREELPSMLKEAGISISKDSNEEISAEPLPQNAVLKNSSITVTLGNNSSVLQIKRWEKGGNRRLYINHQSVSENGKKKNTSLGYFDANTGTFEDFNPNYTGLNRIIQKQFLEHLHEFYDLPDNAPENTSASSPDTAAATEQDERLINSDLPQGYRKRTKPIFSFYAESFDENQQYNKNIVYRLRPHPQKNKYPDTYILDQDSYDLKGRLYNSIQFGTFSNGQLHTQFKEAHNGYIENQIREFLKNYNPSTEATPQNDSSSDTLIPKNAKLLDGKLSVSLDGKTVEVSVNSWVKKKFRRLYFNLHENSGSNKKTPSLGYYDAISDSFDGFNTLNENFNSALQNAFIEHIKDFYELPHDNLTPFTVLEPEKLNSHETENEPEPEAQPEQDTKHTPQAQKKTYDSGGVDIPFFINLPPNKYLVKPEADGRLHAVRQTTAGDAGTVFEIDDGLFFYDGKLHRLDEAGNDTPLSDVQKRLEKEIDAHIKLSNIGYKNEPEIKPESEPKPEPEIKPEHKPEPITARDKSSHNPIPENATLKSGSLDLNGYVIEDTPHKRTRLTGQDGKFNVSVDSKNRVFYFNHGINREVYKYYADRDLFTSNVDAHFYNSSLKKEVERRFREHINEFFSLEHEKTNDKSNASEPISPDSNIEPYINIAQNVKEHILSGKNQMSNQQLIDIASKAFGGTIGEGKFNIKDAYDAMELGINYAILELGTNPSTADTVQDVLDDLDSLFDILSLIPTQRNRTDEQIEFQQFSTPPTLAYLVNWLADIHDGDSVLEPSAGVGGLAVFTKNADAELILNELNPRRAMLLQHPFDCQVFRENAEHINDVLAPKIKDRPNRIIMNPPFSATAGRVSKHDSRNAAKHVEQALQLLDDGGRLVAILGEGMSENSQKFADWWRHIKKKYNVRAVISIDGDNYKKFGTTFGNIIAVIDKDGATPHNGTFNDSFSDLHDVFHALQFLRDSDNDIDDSDDDDSEVDEFEGVNVYDATDDFDWDEYENSLEHKRNVITTEDEGKVLDNSEFDIDPYNQDYEIPFGQSMRNTRLDDVNDYTVYVEPFDTIHNPLTVHDRDELIKLLRDKAPNYIRARNLADELLHAYDDALSDSFEVQDEVQWEEIKKQLREALEKFKNAAFEAKDILTTWLQDNGYDALIIEYDKVDNEYLPGEDEDDDNDDYYICRTTVVVEQNDKGTVKPAPNNRPEPVKDNTVSKSESESDEDFAWHGTPHIIRGTFSLDHIGAGEGHQTFAYGMYYAEEEEAARTYRRGRKNALVNIVLKNGSILDRNDELFGFIYADLTDNKFIPNDYSEKDFEQVRDNLRKRLEKLMERVEDAPQFKDTYKKYQAAIDILNNAKSFTVFNGNLYKVKMPPKNILLNYDAPISEQSDNVLKGLEKIKERAKGWGISSETLEKLNIANTGGAFYVALTKAMREFMAKRKKSGKLPKRITRDDMAASFMLNRYGIPGLIFWDGESRDSQDGTHNFVVWNTRTVKKVAISSDSEKEAIEAFEIENGNTEKEADTHKPHAHNEKKESNPEKKHESKPVRKIKSSEPESTTEKPDKTVKRWNALKKINSSEELENFLSHITKDQLLEIADIERFSSTSDTSIQKSEKKAAIVDKVLKEITRRWAVIDAGHDVTAEVNGQEFVLDTPLIRARKEFNDNGRPEPPTPTPKRGRKPKEQTKDDDAPENHIVSDTKAGSVSSVKVSSKSDEELRADELNENKNLNQDNETINVKENDDSNDDNGEQENQEITVFANYRPSIKIDGAKEHPADLVESAAMASVRPPKVTYSPNLPDSVITEGKLSIAQLEAVTYAGQSFTHRTPKDEVRGFFIGDGTGVGKGREISGVIMDQLRQGYGKGKAVWISKGHELIKDARRDWIGVGNNPNDIFAHENISDKKLQAHNEGIIFSAYSYFSGNTKARVQQLKNWLGEDFDGVIVLDECHLANNAMTISESGKKYKPSATAMGINDFIKAFPNARVLYVSATGASDIRNLSMLDRLGLWGDAHGFTDKNDFVTSLSKGGVAAMELVARDLKAMGVFTSRTLSMKGVTFRTLEDKLNEHQIAIYDKFAEMWQKINSHVDEALELLGGGGKGLAGPKAQFQNYRQKFFNQVLVTLQTPAAIRDMEKQLEAGNSVVIQLTNTFESAQDKAVAELQKQRKENEDLSFDDLDISPIQLALAFLEKCFPVTVMEEVEDEEGNVKTVPALDSNGKPIISQEAVRMRDELIADIKSIKSFTQSPIDLILDHFGHDNVAEITGRTTRYVLDSNGRRVEQKRNENQIRAEIDDFNEGRKRILLFSGKGDTGASYHASNEYRNKQKRIHYLLQAGWRADKAIQGLGRTHRSNEAHAPEYVLVTTDVPGQKRFISTIARRLEQLGALTSGERKASANGLFSASDNLENQYVEFSMHDMLHKLGTSKYPEFPKPDDVFAELGLTPDAVTSAINGHFEKKKKQSITIPQFLNRVLGMSVAMQKKLWRRFEEEIQWAIDLAKKNGTLDTRTENIDVLSFKITDEENIRYDENFGTQTKYVKISAEKSIKPRTWKFVSSQPDVEFYLRDDNLIIAAIPRKLSASDIEAGVKKAFRLLFVNPRTFDDKPESILHNESTRQLHKYTRLSEEQAHEIWDKRVQEFPPTYTEIIHMITGAILPVWKPLSKVSVSQKVQRIVAENGDKILGRIIPPKELDRTLSALGLSHIKKHNENVNAQGLRAKLNEFSGATAILAGNLKMKYVRINGQKRLEVIGFDFFDAKKYTDNGDVIKEIINSKPRYFVITDSNQDARINRILFSHPFLRIENSSVNDMGNDDEGKIIMDVPDDPHNLYAIHPFFRPDPDDNPYVNSSPYAFQNHETEQRWQDSKKVKTESVWHKILHFGKELVKGFKSDFPELYGHDSLIKAQELLRKLNREHKADVQETVNRLREALHGFTPDDYDLFSRAMELADLMETIQINPEAALPWGLDDVSLPAEHQRIMRFVELNHKVKQGIYKAEALGREITHELIEAADALHLYDIRNKLQRQHYFRHVVLDYFMQATGGSGATLKNPNRRGYLKHREGSYKDISSDWITAMGEVWTRMNGDIKILHTLAEIRKHYDIADDLKQQALAMNMQNALDSVADSLRDSYDENDLINVAQGKLNSILNKKQASAISRLFKMANNGDLPEGDNHEWDELLYAMRLFGTLEALPSEYRSSFTRYVGWLAGLDDHSRPSAAAKRFLRSDINKQNALRNILGKKFIAWQDLIPEGYDIWSPVDSRIIFSASTVNENILKIAEQNIDELLGMPLSDIGHALSSGGDKQIWVIPTPLANTLNNMGKKQPQGDLAKGVRAAMSAFKSWVLFSPVNGRVVKYNWRNFFGDLEAVLQGNPGALKYVRQAFNELKNSMLNGFKAKGNLAEFQKRGGALTAESRNELLNNWEDLQEFAHLLEHKKHVSPLKMGLNFFKGYMKLATELTEFREAILRYAAFLSYLDLLKDNDGNPPFYGMSKPNEVDALDDIFDKAFKLANENLGAYDQISQSVKWLRDNSWLTFISWVEVNFRRSIQMYKNIWSGNSFLEFWLRKHGGRFIDMFNGGGGNGGGNKPPKGSNNGGYDDDNSDDAFRKFFRKIRKLLGRSPIYIMRFAITLALSMPLMLILSVFNWLNSENDNKLPPDIRSQPHLTLNTNYRTGEVLYLNRLGSAYDFFDTIGLDDLFRNVKDFFDGRISFLEIANNITDGPISKLVNNFNPLAKAAIEMLTGRKLYPNISRPTSIRDNWEYVAQSLGLDWYYRLITGKPHAPFSDFSGSIAEHIKPDEAAYWFILARKKEFQEKKLGRDIDGFTQTKQGECLYNARKAAQYGDRKRMIYYLQEFYRAGGSEKGLEASVNSMNPLYGLNENEKFMFIQWLPNDERAALSMAEKFYMRMKYTLSF